MAERFTFIFLTNLYPADDTSPSTADAERALRITNDIYLDSPLNFRLLDDDLCALYDAAIKFNPVWPECLGMDVARAIKKKRTETDLSGIKIAAGEGF